MRDRALSDSDAGRTGLSVDAVRLNFGTLLRDMRFDAGLSQEALAERAELSVGAVGALERGLRRLPHPTTVAKLTDALALLPEARSKLKLAASRAPRSPRRRTIVPTTPGSSTPLSPLPTDDTGAADVVVEIRQGAETVVVVGIASGQTVTVLVVAQPD